MNLNVKSILIVTFFTLGSLLCMAQNKMTLKEAIETGIKNNIDVLQSELMMQKSGINMKQSKEKRLPDLNASLNQGTNFGRSIDPFTNSYIDQRVGYSTLGASSNLLLFNGFSLNNEIRSNQLGYEASRLEFQQAKDNLTIKIILSYLNVLSASDMLQQSRELVKVTQKQVDRLETLNKAGAILPSDYYDLKGQLANDQINIVNNMGNLENSKLALAQLLNIPYDSSLSVERLPEENFNSNYGGSAQEIYNTALHHFAQIKAGALRTQSAEKNIQSVKGQLFPVLTLSGNANTNYSSVATRDYFLNSTDVASNNYVNVDGTQYPVIVKQNNYDSRKINFGDQLNNNLYYTVNLNLNIPLFNASRVKNQIKLARIDLKNSELNEQRNKTDLQHAIEEAYINLTSASRKYNLLQDQVESFAESFRTAEIRFNAGAINSVDYLVAKNNLDRANANLILAKYDYMLREKVLDYYGGKSLF